MSKKILLISMLLATIGLIIFNLSIKKPQNTVQSTTNEVVTPVKAENLTSVDSPDGKLTLIMKKVSTRENATYSFSVSGKTIFEKTVDPSIKITIPYNTWSPNGKYVFLKEESPTGASFYALSVTASSSEQNDQTANITNLFAQKYPDLKIADATGWGGVNLIVFNSLKSDGNRGSSFWFEMPSHAIIQLSTHF